MRIAFDVDNVLADSMTCWCKKATKHLSRVVRKEHIKSHKIVGSVPMSPTEIFKLQDEVWNEWRSLPPTEENLSRKLNVFRKKGFKVIIVTSRPLRSKNSVKKWLVYRHLPYDEFHPIGPYRPKSQIKADALVDDAPDQILGFTQTGRTGFLYRQPWNRTVEVRKALLVRSIGDILKHYKLEKS